MREIYTTPLTSATFHTNARTPMQALIKHHF